MKVKIIPLVITALGATPKRLRKWLSEIITVTQITELQKTTVLHISGIFKNVPEI